MSHKSYGNKTYGAKSAYAVLSSLPIGTTIIISLVKSTHEGTWAGFTDGNATIIAASDSLTEYIPLNQINAIYVP